MTARTMHLICEFECVSDVAKELNAVLVALTRRHGALFRDLERRILALQEAPGTPSLFPVDGGFIVTAPAEWTEILKEARRLSVI